MPQPLGTCVLVLDPSQQKVLLGLRKNSYKAGFYGLPGGRIEVGEKTQRAAERELSEETGLITDANDLKYIGAIKEQQDGYDFVHFAFVCSKFSGEPMNKEPDKCEKWKWLDLNSLPQNILPGHKAAIEMYQRKTVGELVEM